MALKWDILCKHESCKHAAKDLATRGIKKGDVYIVKTCRHQINLTIFFAHRPTSILEQVNTFNTLEKRKKKV